MVHQLEVEVAHLEQLSHIAAGGKADARHNEAVGGDGPDKVQMPELPPIGDPGPPPPSPDYDQGDMPEWQYTLPNTSNVESAWKQCAPAGRIRSTWWTIPTVVWTWWARPVRS